MSVVLIVEDELLEQEFLRSVVLDELNPDDTLLTCESGLEAVELARQHQLAREMALKSAEDEGVEVQMSLEDKARLEMQENAVNLAREHPEDVAQLIRTWISEE